MSDFTPGPWKLELGDPPMVADRDGELVVYLPNWIPEYRTERDANARLIASAPTLLEALEEARDAMSHCLEGALSLPRFAADQMKAAVEKADAAINAATGGQQ